MEFRVAGGRVVQIHDVPTYLPADVFSHAYFTNYVAAMGGLYTVLA